RRGAEHRGDAEAGDPDQEQAARPEEVTERAADEEQRPERQQVRVDDPLLEGEAAAQVPLDRRQSDVHDRRVDEDDDGAEDAGDEHEPVPVREHAGKTCSSRWAQGEGVVTVTVRVTVTVTGRSTMISGGRTVTVRTTVLTARLTTGTVRTTTGPGTVTTRVDMYVCTW